MRHLQEESIVGPDEGFSYDFLRTDVLKVEPSKGAKKGKKCKRRTEPKKSKACKKENPYNGLQDLNLIEPDTSPDLMAVGRCLAAFGSSGFDLNAFDKFDNWIDDETSMMVADTGFWGGVDGIQEYIKLALTPGLCKDMPFFTSVVGTTPEQADIFPILAYGNECTILIASKVTLRNSCVMAGALNTVSGFRYSFTILDDATSLQAKILMNRIDLYFPHGSLAYVGEKLANEDYATKICETMESSCQATFGNNCYNSPGNISGVDKCVDDLLSLPATDDGGPSFNGDSFACRVLHANLAGNNDKHCAHISFDPEFDSSCFLKCQQAAGITNSDIFHPMEMGFLAGRAIDYGLPGDVQWKYTDGVDVV